MTLPFDASRPRRGQTRGERAVRAPPALRLVLRCFGAGAPYGRSPVLLWAKVISSAAAHRSPTTSPGE